MGTVILHTLREAVFRRMGLVLLIISLLLPALYVWGFRFETQADGSVMVRSGPRVLPAEVFVPYDLKRQLEQANVLWLVLGIFATAPLLTSYLEKGWAELLLSRGVPRWKMLLARYLGAWLLFCISLLLAYGLPAMYLWAGTGYRPGRFFLGLALTALNFGAVLAMMAPVGVAQSNPALLIIAGFIQVTVSRVLVDRESVYALLNLRWPRPLMDAAYRILPKTWELGRMASGIVDARPVESWWPFWTTVVFGALMLALAAELLHRKSI